MNRLLILGALLALSGPASALDLTYHSYNAFDETVDAFTRLALVVSDNGYVVIAGAFAALSVMFSAMFLSARGMAGQANNPMSMMIPLAVGLAIFFGSVIPKGTVFVYDETLNKTQAVGGVPDIVVLVAGGLNLVERTFVEIIDTASAVPYSEDVGSLTFSAILAASTSKQQSLGLERSIGNYVRDCGLMAIGTGQNGTTMDELVRNSADLRDTLEDYRHPSWPTTWYPATQPGGQGGTCQEAWDWLRPILDDTSDTGPAGQLRAGACLKLGMDISDAGHRAACDRILERSAELFGSAGMSQTTLMRQFVIARGIMNATLDGDFGLAQSKLTNMRMMAEGFGAQEAMQQWVPRIRGLMLSVMLGVTPIVLIFAITSLVYQAVGLFFGMFVFLALWSVCDTATIVMAQDTAIRAFSEITSQRVSYESMMEASSASVEALALVGKYRTFGMILAMVVAGALFKFSSYAFASSSQSVLQDVTDKGARSGVETMTPDSSGQMLASMASSTTTAAAASVAGAGNLMSQNATPAMRGAAAHAMYLDSVSTTDAQGSGYDSALFTGAGADAGRTLGEIRGTDKMASDLGSSPLGVSAAASMAGTVNSATSNIGGYKGTERVANSRGMSLSDAGIDVASASGARTGETALSQQSADRQNFGTSDGDLTAAEIMGMKLSGDTAITAEMASQMQADNPTDSYKQLAGTQNASTIGLIGATQGNSSDAFDRYEIEHKVAGAATDVLRGSEGAVGTGQARGQIRDAAATNAVWEQIGPSAAIAGALKAQAEQAYSGRFAAENGGVLPNAEQIAMNNTANDVAAARIGGQLAQQFGGSANSFQDRVGVAGMRQGQISMVLASESDKQAFISSAAPGSLTEAQAREILHQSGPASVNFAYDTNTGEVGAIQSVTASDIASGNTIRRDSGEINTAGDQYAVRDPRRFTGDEGRTTLERLMGGTYVGTYLSAEDQDTIAGMYMDRATALGQGNVANAGEAYNRDVSVGAEGSGGVRWGNKYAGPHGGASASGSTRVTDSSLESSSSSSNTFFTEMHSAVKSNWDQAQLEASERFGPDQADKANEFIGNRFTSLNDQKFDQLMDLNNQKTADSRREATEAVRTDLAHQANEKIEEWVR